MIFGRTLGEYCGTMKLGLVLILLMTAGRWILSLAGVPYFPRGNVIFSIVLMTDFLALVYPAFARRAYGFSLMQAAFLAFGFGLFSQVVILLSTLVTYGAGLETYFNHPEALNVDTALPMGQAMTTRVIGLLPGSITAGILGLIGYAMGGLLPGRSTT